MALKSNASLAEVLKSASVFLEERGFDGTLAQSYWLRVFDWTLTDLVRQLHQAPNQEDYEAFQKVLNRLVTHEPLQYILGYEDFDGHRFKVTPAVLIPREDTAGILDLAATWLEKHPDASQALDLGTGSGVLAISLALRHPQLHLTAGDLSPEALAIAKENGISLQATVDWLVTDVCQDLPQDRTYDLVVSNPPYISETELDLMDESVKRYEPSMALFAEQGGLAFYRRLAKQIGPYLKPSACLILEIGFRQGQAVVDIFRRAFPQAKVSCHQDLNGRDRYVQVEINE
ncbi:peptide chain release factor N(5)-glutamine methyltransferase [uncultured Abiotrophia sp.]|uniref:peptide chain release factor N(5)-glutamine methyltransferase n=1 Tax=uncultured Abiotrophia sp. TaxID=316094 RepID=UPI0028D06F85|nr:peptide chain release factor N(5)-glutamine methyltransferase [uncultured Abiotrophia sp.]